MGGDGRFGEDMPALAEIICRAMSQEAPGRQKACSSRGDVAMGREGTRSGAGSDAKVAHVGFGAIGQAQRLSLRLWGIIYLLQQPVVKGAAGSCAKVRFFGRSGK